MKKRLVAISLVVAMLAIAIVGGSLAYFTDEDDADNTFTMGNVDILLDEAKVNYDEDTYKWTVDESGERVQSNVYENIYPGAVMPKDPTVHNQGTMDAYVRVKVTITGYTNWANLMGNKLNVVGNAEKYTKSLVGEFGEGWSFVDAEAVPGTHVGSDLVVTLQWDGVLKGGDSTTPVFQQVTLPTDFAHRSAGDTDRWINMVMGYDRTFEILVKAEAIQAPSFDDAAAAWAAFDAEA